ncbi:mRNA splicing factor [Syncephalis fuscata]|nr:mRNA splicing factor [Syncephalis fuscata]
MEDAAKKRKERLQALRAAKEAVDAGERPTANADSDVIMESGQTLRNPVDDNNSKFMDTEESEALKPRKRGPSDLDATVEKAMAGITDKTIAEEAERNKEDMDLFHLAPKKANWDLKRDVEKKLSKLERRTQASIIELIRQRLQGGSDNDKAANLADAVAAQQRQDDASLSGSEEE